MPMSALDFELSSPDETAALAAKIGPLLKPGDVLLLEGEIGAGKTHFARALIQAMLPVQEDVPSPTFTLVQIYDTQKGEIWHADLYRLSQGDEIIELGLAEAFEDAICLVEWPERLAALTPNSSLLLRFRIAGGSTRRLTLSWTDPDWTARLSEIAHESA